MAQENKKTIKKKFFDVEIPLTATKAKLYAGNPEELHNKVVTIDMTKNLKGKNLELKARVHLKDGKLTSNLISMIVVPSSIRRVLRRGTDYVEDSFVTSCKDALLRVKPFMLTRNRVSRAVRREIRNATRKFLESYMTIKNTKEIFSELMTNKLQKNLSLKVKKVYPLAFCEIRWIEVIGEPKIK
jgi:ribosomal protein S3AE